MKPSTQHHSRINDVLYEIHRDLAAPLTGRELARIAAYSEQHFHRVFQEVVGDSVHHYIRNVRLEQAANQLMFDPHLAIVAVAEKCGFKSLSSFSRAFKDRYGVTPGQWRKQSLQPNASSFADKNWQDPDIAKGYRALKDAPLPKATLVEREPQQVAYLRHKGYDKDIAITWRRLLAWASSEGRATEVQIGLHHSNPILVPLPECHYVACLGIDTPLVRRGHVNSLCIPGGLHGAFELRGCYGELLPYMSKICNEWLPDSGFKMRTTPLFVDYKNNHLLGPDERFDLTLYIPLSVL